MPSKTTRRKAAAPAAVALTSDQPAQSPVYGILRLPVHRRIQYEEINRQYWGRQLNLQTIDSAIRNANRGYMRQLTDLSLETMRLDGHTSALWQKRLNRLSVLDWDLLPATGENIDKQMAEDYCGLVREQLQQIPNFRQCLTDLNQGHYHGRAASEIEWMHHGGRWRVANLHWLHARRLSFGRQRDIRIVDVTNEVGGFSESNGEPLSKWPYKFIGFTPRMFGDYSEREGLAPRHVFWSFFSRFGVRERLHLIEVFGKPWRIASPKWDPKNPTAINPESVDDAFEALNSLGAHSTAVLPISMDVLVAQPTRDAGKAYGDSIEHAEKIISKLFLGATGTTDAISTGLGSNVATIHRSEEDLIILSDAWRLAEAIEDQLTDPIIVVNFGPDAVRHAPKFVFKTDPPGTPMEEAATIKAILELGIDMSLSEVRERLGVREVTGDEPIVRRAARNINGTISPYAPMPEVLYPDGTDQHRLIDIPNVDGAAPPAPPAPPPFAPPPLLDPIKPPPALPPGPPALSLPPSDVELDSGPDESTAALAAAMTEHGITRCEHQKLNRCRICGVERDRGLKLGEDGKPVMDDDGSPQWNVRWRPIGGVGAPTLPDDLPVAATSRRRRLAEPRLAFGDAGAHQHYVDREGEKLALGGEHIHAFLIDGTLIFTEIDGPHEHRDDEAWEHAGDHYHRLGIPGGGALDTEIGGHHYHGKGVSVTGVDGWHTHVLKLTDGRAVQSLTSEELADLLEDEEEDEEEGGEYTAKPPSLAYSTDPAAVTLRRLAAANPETESARVEQAAGIIEALAHLDPEALAAALLQVTTK